MNIRDKILDAAEARMRLAGYNAASFRDIAGDVGIKSASVHYHFPQKEDLGEAVMNRYSDRQFDALADATDGISDPMARIQALVTMHDQAFVAGERICLCAMLSAESQGLPDRVNQASRRFFDGTLVWLRETLEPDQAADRKAEAVLALLQGALLVAAVHRDGTHFRKAAAGVAAIVGGAM